MRSIQSFPTSLDQVEKKPKRKEVAALAQMVAPEGEETPQQPTPGVQPPCKDTPPSLRVLPIVACNLEESPSSGCCTAAHPAFQGSSCSFQPFPSCKDLLRPLGPEGEESGKGAKGRGEPKRGSLRLPPPPRAFSSGW